MKNWVLLGSSFRSKMLWLGLTSIKSQGRLPSQSVIFIKALPLRSLSLSATHGKWRRLSWQWFGLHAISGWLLFPPLPNNAVTLLTTSTLSTSPKSDMLYSPLLSLSSLMHLKKWVLRLNLYYFMQEMSQSLLSSLGKFSRNVFDNSWLKRKIQ